ncbi:MAG: hypothetical protein ACR2JE_17370 [Acidobacteriaceae bacterium]
MSRYRKVDPRIWNDAKFRALSDQAKLVFFMLLTHPGMTALGGMRATIAGLAEELGWSAEAFREAFREASKQGMAKQDEKACLIALPNFLRYNGPESPNVVRAWASSVDLLPECELKCLLIQRAKVFAEGMSKGFGEAFSEAFPKAMPNQEQEQEQEQDLKAKTCRQRAEDLALSSPLPLPVSDEREECLREVWLYYLAKFNRRTSYEFDKTRRKYGLAGFDACAKMARQENHPEPRKAAVELMKIAIDRMAVDPYHNGANDQKTKYLEWEHLFRGKNFEAPQKITKFWLNEDQWEAA